MGSQMVWHFLYPSCLIMNYNNFWKNVLKEDEWVDELIKWENAHPEYKPFKEDKDSQRQQNSKENY